MRPCECRFVTTFSSLLDRETPVVHSRPRGAGGFVGAQVSRAGRRSRPSRRRQRPVGIERPRGQALPKDAIGVTLARGRAAVLLAALRRGDSENVMIDENVARREVETMEWSADVGAGSQATAAAEMQRWA